MKKGIKLLMFLSLLTMIGCNYLEVVPDDAPSIDHAFSNRSVTEKFLRTCYSSLPDVTNPYDFPAYYTSNDEFSWWDSRVGDRNGPSISKGLQNANNPYLDYWSGERGGKALYQGIRNCNIFLENIHVPQDIEEGERSRWVAEVKFLKAYYHFFLMKLYGPIVLVNENIPLSASPSETQVYREPVDSVVNFIVNLLDEAIGVLPLSLPDEDSEFGRISGVIASAVKADVLVWAASPLFNGNKDYESWIDNRGVQLIPSDYDPSKWSRAAEAIREAILVAEGQGKRFYEFNKFAGGSSTFQMNDTLVQLMTIRKSITEDIDKNPDIIWASQEKFENGKGGVSFARNGNMISSLFPQLYPEDALSYVNYASASWHMAELFYTNNGVPMDNDKYFDVANKYEPRIATLDDNHKSYIATGEVTANYYFNREPRFYADIAFDRGFMELSTTTSDNGRSFLFWKNRGENGVTNGSLSINPKKIIPFEASVSQGDPNKRYSEHDYRFPIIRLEDLYLLYSEALNEVKSQPDADVYEWIDAVRIHAGLKGVVESWEYAAFNPEAPKSKNSMRDIIRRERLIEFAFEGKRFWDLKRWKMADQYWSLPKVRWTRSENPEEYFKPEIIPGTERQVSPKDYLWPIRDYDLRVNPNLEQTFGW